MLQLEGILCSSRMMAIAEAMVSTGRVATLNSAMRGGMTVYGSAVRWVIGAAIAAMAVGCGSERVGVDETLWYDSDVPLWSLGDATVFRSSWVELQGDTVYLSGIHGAEFDENGGVVLALRRGGPLLVQLDSLGHAQWVTGRPGEGPGEFRFISDLLNVGDKAFIWDAGLGRVSVFDESTFRGDTRFSVRGGRRLLGMVDDTLLLATSTIVGARPGATRRYERWSLRSGEVDVVDGFVESQGNVASFPVTYDGGGHTVRTDLPPCIVGTLDAVREGRVYVANVGGAAGRVYVLDPMTLRRRMLYRTDARPVVSESLLRDVEERFRRIEESVRAPSEGPGGVMIRRSNVRLEEDSVVAIRTRIGSPGTPLGSTWMDMIVDESSGHLWLRRAVCEEDHEQEWEVIDTEGRLVARALLPDSMQVRDVKYPKILVTVLDSLDVEHLAIVSLEPG